MPLYRAQGVLTGTIEAENVAQADAYLREHDMTQFLDEEKLPVEHIEWKLEADGHAWNVTVFATDAMNDDQLRVLSEWVSGQNSDGLGESFEQQDFAWSSDGGACGDCYSCEDSEGYCDNSEGSMISFDWETNDIVWERVK